MKNKDIKIIVIVLVLLFSCIGAYKIADARSLTFVKAKAEYYLCKKYDADLSEIKLVDYKRAHIYWDDRNIFFLVPEWDDFSFEFQYNGREVFVNRQDGKFYDDYQLEDLEVWCTQWLQDNVDDRIVGLDIDSTDILWYQMYYSKNSNYIITNSDAQDFLNCYTFSDFDTPNCTFYFFDENVDYERRYEITSQNSQYEIGKEICSKLHEKLTLKDRIDSCYTVESSKKKLLKLEGSAWIFYIDYI